MLRILFLVLCALQLFAGNGGIDKSHDDELSNPNQVILVRIIVVHSGGYNWHAYSGGDPVNRFDPTGLDWVSITANGDVIYQAETDGFWADYNDGEPFVIGKATGIGEYFQISDEYGGGLLDLHALRTHIRGVYLGDHLGDRDAMKHAIRSSLRESFMATNVGVHTPWLDRTEGALRVAYEPAGLVKNLVEGVGSVGTGNGGIDTDSVRADGFFPDSMVFRSAASQLDAGRGTWEVGVDLIPEMVGRTNIITAPMLAANDIRVGEQTGDYQRSGGGAAILGMFVAAPAGAQGIHMARARFAPASRLSSNLVDNSVAIPDNALVHVSPVVRAVIVPNQGKSFWFRYGDIKGLTPAQLEALIGDMAGSGQPGGARFLHVMPPEAAAQATQRPYVLGYSEYTIPTPVTPQSVVPINR